MVPVSGGLHHKFHAEGGMTFMEAVVPVPLDDIPDTTADPVLGEAGGVHHVVR